MPKKNKKAAAAVLERRGQHQGDKYGYTTRMQPGRPGQKWNRADNPWFDPLFTGTKITTPYDRIAKPLSPDFWDSISAKLQQTAAPSEYDLALATVRGFTPSTIHYGSVSPLTEPASDSGNILKSGWSAFNWTMDKLARPMYGVENVVLHNLRDIKKDSKDGFSPGEAIKALVNATPVGLALGANDFWKGFSGKEKVSGAKIAKAAGIDNKWGKAAVGFGIDIGADPLTYIPGGAIIKALKSTGKLKSLGKGAKAIEGLEKADKGLPSGDRQPFTTGEQLNLFGEKEPAIHLGPERKPADTVIQKTHRMKGQGALFTEDLRPKFGPESPSAAVAKNLNARKAATRQVSQVPDYPGTGYTLKEGQTFFQRNAAGKMAPTAEHDLALSKMVGKNATPAQIKAARTKLRNRVMTPVSKNFDNALLKNGVTHEELATLKEALGNQPATSAKVRELLGPMVASRNVHAQGDFMQGLAASQPAHQIMDDAAQGDLFANLAIDSAGNPLKSMAGNAGTTGGGNKPIRTIEELTDVERDIAHRAMDKHGSKNLYPIEQADLVQNIRNEARKIIAEQGKKNAPQEAKDIAYSASNASAIARAAMERLSREGVSPKNKLGHDWNILDIEDMIGGRKGFEKMFNRGKKLPAGDVSHLHTLSKYATQTARYLAGEKGATLPAEVRGKPGFINAVRQMMNAGEAATSIKEAKMMQPILEDISRVAREVALNGSDAEVANAIVKRVNINERVLRAQGMSDSGIKTFRAAAAAMKYPKTPEGQVFLDRASAIANGTIKADPADAGVRRAADELTTELNGGASAPEILDVQVHDVHSRAVEHGIWSRFAGAFKPHRGSADLHQAMLRNISYRQDQTNMFRSYLTQLEKRFTKQQLREAHDLLRSGMPAADNEAAVAMKAMWDNTLRATGLAENVVEGQSMALRSGITMDEVNRELRILGSRSQMRKYAYDVQNRKVDLSEGSRWLESAQWQQVDDVTQHMAEVRHAVEQAMLNRSFMYDVGKNFGKLERGGEHTYKLTGTGTESIAGHYFTKDVAEQMSVALRKLEELKQPSSQGRKLLENSMGAYKTVFTVMNPRHHVVNNIGNTFLNWMQGVNNPRVYFKAADVSKYANSVIKDLDNIEDVLGPGAYARSMARDVDAHKIILKSKGKNGTTMNVQQVFLAAKEKGIIIGAHSAEDIAGASRTWLSHVPIAKTAEKWGRVVSEQTENHSRYAMFIDILSKHKGEITDNVLNDAAATVRKWHPDGTDLTNFERRNMRLLIPFYSWTRKAIPLMVEGIVHNPKKLVAIPKAQAAWATMMGIDPGTFADPFPADKAWPDWIRESGIGPSFAPGMDVPGFPKFGGYGVGSANVLPPTAIAEMFSGRPSTIGAQVMSQTNPLLRMPIEEFRGKQFFGDKEIKDQSQYFATNLPGTAQYTQISGRDPLGGNEPFGAGYYRKKETGSAFSPVQLANWMTGMGLKDTGPYTKDVATTPKKKKASDVILAKKQSNAK